MNRANSISNSCWISKRGLGAITLIGLLTGILLSLTIAQAATDPASSSPDHDSWYKTTSGCEIWISKPHPDLVITWSGECIDGRVSGQGIMESASRGFHERYEGEMANGKMNGYGTADYPLLGKISAKWRNGVLEGKVIADRLDGFHYEGDWQGGPEGVGIGSWPSGAQYQGNWHNGVETGHGVLTYKNGTRIEGEWDHHRLVGRVSAVNSTGDRYEGTLKDLKRDGIGTFIWSNGDRYDGNWIDNLPNGSGTLKRADGAAYTGIWQRGCFRDGDRRVSLFVPETACQ